ncbi:hypothetical protein HZS35_18150 [Pantoea brenneri]|uniref:Uncharacterized protein n=1 Tax=Pantoea brenneri TaxID=472694 RepID=A0A7Y6TTK4_9GAMM|nr:hypothetical protein [Pantoea brenneri]NUY50962.1 hypothetical protein [Pantoea brenneri]NUY61307.1 hypothetical protein [Pantoea brenneri]NUY65838.1 hypothetical protein [Pantoea brenneri]NUY73444.1 hypothetical protein [Pantoea brenneri]
MLTNTTSTKAEYPPTVVYRNADTRTDWSRPLSDWHRSFTLVSEYPNEYPPALSYWPAGQNERFRL